MIDAYLSDDGGPCLVIVESAEHDRVIPLQAIATWRELLGIDDPIQCVEAICYVQDHPEPDPDPETGRNSWSDSFALLRRREGARAVEAAKAQADRVDRVSMIERANRAAFDAVHIPVQGDKCAMDLCREQAQRELGLPEVAAKCGPDSRTVPCVIKKPARAEHETIGPLPPGRARAERIAECLQGYEPELLECTQRFLHGLSGDETDRITPPKPKPEPAPKPRRATADELLARYRGT